MLTRTQNTACEHGLATEYSIFRFILIGTLTGFTSALFAAGGAPVIVFGLLWFCGYGIKETTGPSLATLAVGALIGFSLRFYLQSADLQLHMAMIMLPFGLGGVIAGHIVAKYWSCKSLQVCFSCFVAFIGLKMMGMGFFPALSLPWENIYLLLCGTAALAGFGSRILGTGGGLLTVPALMYTGITPHQALITSLCLNIPMMLFGTSLNLRSQSPQWKELRSLIFGAMVGASVGAYISYMYIPDILLQMLFGGLLIVSAGINIFPDILRIFYIYIIPCIRLHWHESRSPIQ